MGLSGEDVEEIFETFLPEEELSEVLKATGFQVRERFINAMVFLRAMLIASSTQNGARQASIMKEIWERAEDRPARASFYAKFGPPLEKCLIEIQKRVLEFALSQKKDLGGILGKGVSDWLIHDSSEVKLRKELCEEYPGKGDGKAAVKVHLTYSIGYNCPLHYHFSPAKEADIKHFSIDESLRGKGILLDLGYASLNLLESCEKHDVKYVIRLKENWKPKVLQIHEGEVYKAFFKGTDLDTLLLHGNLKFSQKPLDAKVCFGKQNIESRLVVVQGKSGYCLYLTNLPAKTHKPSDVSDLYRIRWEVERHFKVMKSCQHMGEIDARKGVAVRALLHASILSSMMVCMLAHRHNLADKPKRKGELRTKPPLHPQSVARFLASAAKGIAEIMEMPDGKEKWKRWDILASGIIHFGQDPNWRTSPSILDQMRGWKHPGPVVRS